jgi:cardiolipin synthase
MYQDCVDAKRSIAFEQYIFENDEVGQRFLRLFIHKAKEGLTVHLLCDEVGSRTFCNSPLVEEFRTNGGGFRFYNSLKFIDLLKPRRLFPRTHVKTLVVDAAIAYVGGVCIDQRMQNWRDTQIRITGPVVQRIKEISDCNFAETEPSKDLKESSNSDFFYVQSAPKFFRHPLYSLLLHNLEHAQDFVYLSTAFFVPTRRMRRFLKKASSRGASVIVLIPHHSDFWIADWACLSYAKKLLKADVRIFRYQPTVLHNKTVVIDGAWGTVGSSNMDALSCFHNRESNLIVRDKEALAEMKKDFLNDLRHSQELTLDLLNQIPLWKRAAMHVARVCRTFL